MLCFYSPCLTENYSTKYIKNGIHRRAAPEAPLAGRDCASSPVGCEECGRVVVHTVCMARCGPCAAMARLVCTLVLVSLACLTWQEESLMVVYPTNSRGSHTQLNLIEDDRSSLVQKKHMRSTLKPVYRTKSSSSVSTSYSVSSSKSSERIHVKEEPRHKLGRVKKEELGRVGRQGLRRVGRHKDTRTTEQYREKMRDFYNKRKSPNMGIVIPPTRYYVTSVEVTTALEF